MNQYLSETTSLLRDGIIHMLVNPILYFGLILVVLELIRGARFEKQFFGLRVTHVRRGTFNKLWSGFCVGVILSLLMGILGIVVATWEIWAVSAVTLILGLIRLRLTSPIYSVSLLTIGSLFAKNGYLSSTHHQILDVTLKHLTTFSLASWVGICGAALVAESLLCWMQADKDVTPTIVHGKRGRGVGALAIRCSFLVPLFPIISGVEPVHSLSKLHWPLIGNLIGGIALSCIPILIGFSTVVTARQPKRYMKVSTRSTFITGFVLLALAVVAHQFEFVAIVGLVLAVVTKEALMFFVRRNEAIREPIFSHSESGVRILGCLRGSLAESMELLPGEIITHVNQIPVHTPYDLHFAFDQNPAYAKLTVLDERGEVRIVGKPVYAGERTKLGLILAPDGYSTTGQTFTTCGTFHNLYAKVSRSSKPDLFDSSVTDATIPPSI